METLVSKMNLNQENKDKILKLGWNKKEYKNLEDKSNIIIIGNKKYIDDVNIQIKEKNINNATIIDCYDFEDTKDKIENLMEQWHSQEMDYFLQVFLPSFGRSIDEIAL